MLKTNVRLAEPGDTQRFVEWVTRDKTNGFDPDIVRYPSLRTLAVDINDEPAIYLPFHPVMMIESLAHKPDLSPREIAYAMAEFEKTLLALARVYHMSEVFFQTSNPRLKEMALRRGYDLITCPVLRKKVATDEPDRNSAIPSRVAADHHGGDNPVEGLCLHQEGR